MTKRAFLPIAVLVLLTLSSFDAARPAQVAAASPGAISAQTVVMARLLSAPGQVPRLGQLASQTLADLPVITPDNAPFVTLLKAAGSGMSALVYWSPIGDRIASLSNSGICLFAADSLKLDRCLGDGIYADMAFSPDGREIAAIKPAPEDAPTSAVASASGTLEVWDIEAAREISTLNQDGKAWSNVAFSQDGKWIAAASQDGQFYLWNAASLAFEKKLAGASEAEGVEALAFAPPGDRLVGAFADGVVMVWPVGGNTASTLTRLARPLGILGKIWISQDSQVIALCGNEADVLNLQTGAELSHFGPDDSHLPGAGCGAMTPDGQVIFIGNAVWDPRTKKQIGAFPEFAAAISPDGKTIVSQGFGIGTSALYLPVKSIALEKGPLTQAAPELGITVDVRVAFALSPDQKLLAESGVGGQVRIWDLSKLAVLRTLNNPADPGSPVLRLRFSPDEKYLAGGDNAGGFSVWNVSDGSLLTKIAPGLNGGGSAALAFSPDSRYLVAGTAYRIFTLDLQNVKQINEPDFQFSPEDLAYSPDGKTIVASLWENSKANIAILDPMTLRTLELRRWEGPAYSGFFPALAFNPQGDYFVTPYSTGLGILSTTVQDPLNVLPFDYTSGITAMAHHPTLPRLLIGAEDGAIFEWDLSSGAIVNTYAGPTQEVAFLAYSSDGQALFAGSVDGQFYQWSEQPDSIKLTLASSGCQRFSISRSGKTLACLGQTTVFWDLSTLTPIKAFGIPNQPASPQVADAFENSPSATALFSSEYAFGKVYEQILQSWSPAQAEGVEQSVLSPDGKKLAVNTKHGNIALFDLENQKLLHTWSLHPVYFPMKLVFGPDGKILYATQTAQDSRGSIAALDATSGETTFFGTDEVESLSVSPDGRFVASAHQGISIFDTRTLTTVQTLEGGDDVTSLAFSPDGNVLAASVMTRTLSSSTGSIVADTMTTKKHIALWATVTGKLLKTLDDKDAQCSEILFTPDGASLISAGCEAGAIKIWGVPPGSAPSAAAPTPPAMALTSPSAIAESTAAAGSQMVETQPAGQPGLAITSTPLVIAPPAPPSSGPGTQLNQWQPWAGVGLVCVGLAVLGLAGLLVIRARSQARLEVAAFLVSGPEHPPVEPGASPAAGSPAPSAPATLPRAAAPNQVIYCQSCGYPNDAAGNYCLKCGRPLVKP